MRTHSMIGLSGLVLVQSLAVPALAAEAGDKNEAAHHVLLVSFSPESYKKITESVAAQLPPEARADVGILLPTYQEMEDLQMALLIKYFTTAELNDMSKFYASSAGKKAIKVMPQIANDAQTFLMERVQKEMPTLVAKVKARTGASGPTAAPAGSPSAAPTAAPAPAAAAAPAPAAATQTP